MKRSSQWKQNTYHTAKREQSKRLNYLVSFYFNEKAKSCPVVLATCTNPLSGILTHPTMYKVPIRWYNLSLICIGWIPGPDFGVQGTCSSHWKVVKGVLQPRTWENDPFGGVCDPLDLVPWWAHGGRRIWKSGIRWPNVCTNNMRRIGPYSCLGRENLEIWAMRMQQVSYWVHFEKPFWISSLRQSVAV